MASKKEALKRIIRDLHGGLDAETARRRVLDEVGSIQTKELVAIEQELIDEGLPPEEVARFCNVHALLVRDSLSQPGADPRAASARPIALLTDDNGRIRRIVGRLRALLGGGEPLDVEGIAAQLGLLGGIDRHYAVKENTIFPYLEKHGFPGPSKVMWEKDNAVRALYKAASAALEALRSGRGSAATLREAARLLLDEVDGMVTKEEQILFPAAAERLAPDEWARITIELEELGMDAGRRASEGGASAAPAAQDAPGSPDSVALPSGRLSVGELEAILNALPVDLSFVDADDRVRYFNETRERIFMRTRAVVGRAVRNCHPPKSLPAVEKVMDDLRSGRADHHDYWIDLHGKMVLIRYYAVRKDGKYLGTLEVTQDVTEIRGLKGEKRLVEGPGTAR